MELITPKSAVETVLRKKTKDVKFQPYETTAQKWLLGLSVASLGWGFVLALSTYVWANKYLVIVALLSIFISSILAMGYQIASIIPELSKFRNVEKEVSTPFVMEFNNDLDTINELSQNYELHHLNFAKANFVLMAKQLRERIGLLVGALEKVGLIPLATTGYFAFLKAQKEGLQFFSDIGWIFSAFAFLYLVAVRMTATAQWMERVSEIYEQAISLKLRCDSQR